MSDIAQVGAVTLPANPSLITGPTGSLKDALDPAAVIMLGLFEAAIKGDLSDVWDAVKGKTKFDGYVIAQTLNLNPEPYIAKGEKLGMPMLALWREKATFKDFSLYASQVQQTWNLTYVIGECSIAEVGILNGLLNGVHASIVKVINGGGSYPAYLDGYGCLIDYQVPEQTTAGFISIDIIGDNFLPWNVVNGDSLISFPALNMTIVTCENTDLVDSDSVPFLGALIHGNVSNNDGNLGTLNDVAEADTEIPIQFAEDLD